MADVSIALCTHADLFPFVYSAANLSKLRFASSVNDTVMMVLSSLMVEGTTMLLINNPSKSIRVGGRLGLGVRGEYYSGVPVVGKIESVCMKEVTFAALR